MSNAPVAGNIGPIMAALILQLPLRRTRINQQQPADHKQRHASART
jgi:hypothetical protein